MNWLIRWVEQIEERNLTAAGFSGTLFSVIVVRNQLENALEGAHLVANHALFYANSIDLLHIIISWLTLFLLPAMAMSLVINYDIKKILNIVLVFSPLIIIVPIIDFVFGKSGYIFYQHTFNDFAKSFIHLFNPFVGVEYVTPGVRIEIAVFLVSVFVYACCREKSSLRWIKASFLALIVYLIIFVVGFLPAFWSWIFSMTSEEMLQRSVLTMTPTKAKVIWYIPLFLPAVIFYVLRLFPCKTKALLSVFRPSRLAVYLVLLNIGFISASFKGLIDYDWLNPLDICVVFLMNCAIACAFVSQVVLNDWYDLEIDKISNPERPLVGNVPPVAAYRLLGVSAAVASLLISLVIHDLSFLVMLFIHCLGFMYSAPPLRVRTVPFLSHALLATIAMGVVMFGTVSVLGNLSVQQVNLSIIWVVGVLFFIGVHFKDIKDETGDRQGGVTTLATLIGARKAFWVTGCSMLGAFYVFINMGILKNCVQNWSALALFLVGLVSLRDAEKIFWFMAPAASVILLTLI